VITHQGVVYEITNGRITVILQFLCRDDN